jgi:hypothetical protein
MGTAVRLVNGNVTLPEGDGDDIRPLRLYPKVFFLKATRSAGDAVNLYICNTSYSSNRTSDEIGCQWLARGERSHISLISDCSAVPTICSTYWVMYE